MFCAYRPVSTAMEPLACTMLASWKKALKQDGTGWEDELTKRSVLLLLQVHCLWYNKDDRRVRELTQYAIREPGFRIKEIPNEIGLFSLNLLVDFFVIRFLLTKFDSAVEQHVLEITLMRCTVNIAKALDHFEHRQGEASNYEFEKVCSHLWNWEHAREVVWLDELMAAHESIIASRNEMPDVHHSRTLQEYMYRYHKICLPAKNGKVRAMAISDFALELSFKCISESEIKIQALQRVPGMLQKAMNKLY